MLDLTPDGTGVSPAFGGCVDRSLFQASDLLHHIAGISNPNHSGVQRGLVGWGTVTLELRVPALPELRKVFQQMQVWPGCPPPIPSPRSHPHTPLSFTAGAGGVKPLNLGIRNRNCGCRAHL